MCGRRCYFVVSSSDCNQRPGPTGASGFGRPTSGRSVLVFAPRCSVWWCLGTTTHSQNARPMGPCTAPPSPWSPIVTWTRGGQACLPRQQSFARPLRPVWSWPLAIPTPTTVWLKFLRRPVTTPRLAATFLPRRILRTHRVFFSSMEPDEGSGDFGPPMVALPQSIAPSTPFAAPVAPQRAQSPHYTRAVRIPCLPRSNL